MKLTLHCRVSGFAAGLVTAVCMHSAGAQAVIEEVVVTAQKREQSLQDVPIAVSAYDSESLQRAGIRDLRDLQQLSPSLILTSTQSESAGTTARLRGVGTTGDNLGLESSVAVFVDGVYRNRNSVALSDFGELERIEVLRGPQGTLFGKNASAGLIHVITKDPDLAEFGGYVEGVAGDFDQYNARAGLTGPIIRDALAFRLDASWSEREGFIDDIANGDQYNDRDRYLVRGQLAGDYGDFSWRLIGDYSEHQEQCCAAVTDIAGPTAAIINGQTPLTGFQPLGTVITPADPFARDTTVTQRIGYRSDVEEKGLSLQLDWDVGPGTLTSITAWRDWQSDRSQDLDYTNADILFRPFPSELAGVGEVGYGNDFETLSQELRYAGSTGRLEWLVGLYYVDEELQTLDGIRTGGAYTTYVNALLLAAGENPIGSLGPVFADGDGAIQDAFVQDTDSIAFFTHNTLYVTDQLGLTLGLRYTEEEKKYTGTLLAQNTPCLAAAVGGNPDGLGQTGISLACLSLINPLLDAPNLLLGRPGPWQDERSDREWSGTFVIDYKFDTDSMVYLSYGRGYKAGGFNLDRAGFANPLLGGVPRSTDLNFDAETVDSWEIGWKASAWDNRVTFNLAAYLADYNDFQLNLFNGLNFLVINLDEVNSKGVEFETQAFLTEGWSLNVGIGYNDARYGSEVQNPVDPTTGQPIELARKRLTNAPEWIVTAGTNYERPLGRLLGYVYADYRFVGRHNTGSDLDPEKVQAGYGVVNGAIGIAADDRFWEVEIWSRNLFDRDYRQVVFDAPLQNGSWNAFLGDPRTWGIRARINF